MSVLYRGRFVFQNSYRLCCTFTAEIWMEESEKDWEEPSGAQNRTRCQRCKVEKWTASDTSWFLLSREKATRFPTLPSALWTPRGGFLYCGCCNKREDQLCALSVWVTDQTCLIVIRSLRVFAQILHTQKKSKLCHGTSVKPTME